MAPSCTCMGPAAARKAFSKRLSGSLSSLGRLVAQWPRATVIASLVVVALCGAGLMSATLETRALEIYVPRGSEGYRDFTRRVDTFGREPRRSDIVFSVAENDNILSQSRLSVVLAAVREVTSNLTGSVNGQSEVFEDVCYREYLPNGPCVRSGLDTALLPSDIEALAAAGTLGAAVKASIGSLGAYVGSFDASLSTARHLRFFWSLEPVEPSRKLIGAEENAQFKRVTGWELALLNRFKKSELAGGAITTSAFSDRSIDDEIERAVSGQLPFMVGAVITTLVYVTFMLGNGRPCERFLLGLSTVVTMLGATTIGFGLSSVFISFTALSFLIVFLIAGITADDVIVLVDAFDRTPRTDAVGERLAAALSEAGASMFLTSVTNMLAFWVASSVDMPGVSSFCVTAGFCIVALFVLTITFFSACLVLDEGRARSIRRNETGPRKPSLTERALRVWSGVVVRRWFGWCLIAVMAAMMGVSVWAGATQMKIGIPLEDSFPDGSYVVSHLNLLEDEFVAINQIVDLVVFDVNGDRRRRVNMSLPRFVSDERYMIPPLRRNWVPQTNATTSMQAFLAANPEFQRTLVLGSGAGAVAASRMEARCVVGSETQARINEVAELRRAYAALGLGEDSFIYGPSFPYTDRDAAIEDLITQTLTVAGACICIVVYAFLPLRSTAIVAMAVLFIDLMLFFIMYAGTIQLDVATYVLLTTAVGFSVDGVGHVALAFESAPADGGYHRARYALEHMGVSVFKAGQSSFLGVVLLAFSQSGIFRLFFKLLSSIFALGLFAGLVIFPAIASLFLPPADLRRDKGATAANSATDAAPLSSSALELPDI